MMHANASDGAKVLPIARISIRNTGMLSTTAEASGNSNAGLQPPMRWRSHERDGAYASENTSAAMIIEVTVALRASPSTTKNFDNSSDRPNSQETREIDTNFMCYLFGHGLHRSFFNLCNPWLLNYFFEPMPRPMMCCISSALGIPRSVAGLNPNGPPSVFAANVMLSPCA